MRSAITLAVGAALVAALVLIFSATATSAAALSPVEQDVPAAPTAANVLDVLVDAQTSFTRTLTWDISKSAAEPEMSLFAGDTDVISYTVHATKTTSQTGFNKWLTAHVKRNGRTTMASVRERLSFLETPKKITPTTMARAIARTAPLPAIGPAYK